MVAHRKYIVPGKDVPLPLLTCEEDESPDDTRARCLCDSSHPCLHWKKILRKFCIFPQNMILANFSKQFSL